MTTTHRVRWYGIGLPDGQRIPRNQHMHGRDWGWDAECSCGWDSRTGGAIQERIIEAIQEHRDQADYCVTHGHVDSAADRNGHCLSCGATLATTGATS